MMEPHGHGRDDDRSAPDASLRGRDDLAEILAMVRAVARELARRTWPRVMAREDPSDLAQSVVVELLTGADRLDFRGVAAARGLATRILSRLISDRLRMLRTRKRDASREVSLAAVNRDPTLRQHSLHADDPAAAITSRELLELGRQRLQRLPVREREVFSMRTAGASHREIAELLGISEAYSQRLLADARNRLREADRRARNAP